MKKYIISLLTVALAIASLSACSSSDSEIETETSTESTETEIVETETETETETTIPEPVDVEVIDFEILNLAKDPVYENGVFVLYFTEQDVWYDENTVLNVGVVAEDEAYTIKGTIDYTTYPDMKIDDNNYCGIAFKPAFDIDPGNYRFSITFDEYKVEFNMDV